MSKAKFVEFAVEVGLTTACLLAIANGVPAAQVDLWKLSIASTC